MKNSSLNSTFIYGIPLLMMISAVFIIYSPSFKTHTALFSFSVTFDFIISIPLVYYFLVRKLRIANKTVYLLFTVNLILASFFIPKQNQVYLDLFKYWVLPFMEFFSIGYLIYHVRTVLKKVAQKESTGSDFFTLLKEVLSEIIPKKAVIPLATEIATFYYGFINWKKIKLKNNEFSYHKNTGITAILIGFMFSSLIEIIVLHKIVLKWNETIAWILVILSLYTFIQFFGILRALSMRPIIVDKKGIYLRYSIINDAFIKYKNIKNIESYTKEIEKNSDLKYFSPFGKIEGNNIKIELNNEITITSFYGIKRKSKNIILFIDKKNEFISQVKFKKNNLSN